MASPQGLLGLLQANPAYPGLQVQLWKGHVGRSQGTLQSAALSPALCLAPNPDSNRLAVGHHSDDVWVYSHPWGQCCLSSGEGLGPFGGVPSVQAVVGATIHFFFFGGGGLLKG